MSGAIGFARIADGFRGWLSAVSDEGTLRTGLVAGDFVATIINPGDTANTIAAVSESTQKPGVYKFDVPSAFFTAHGAGEYAVIVQVDTVNGPSDPPNVVDIVTAILTVSQQDFDTLASTVWDEPVSGHTTAGSTGAELIAGSADEAQLNVAYDATASRIYLELWLDRGGRSVAAGSLVSCAITVYDKDGAVLVSATQADAVPVPGSPQANGRYNLEKASVSLTSNRPYNASVTVTDTAGAVTTFQAFTVIG